MSWLPSSSPRKTVRKSHYLGVDTLRLSGIVCTGRAPGEVRLPLTDYVARDVGALKRPSAPMPRRPVTIIQRTRAAARELCKRGSGQGVSLGVVREVGWDWGPRKPPVTQNDTNGTNHLSGIATSCATVWSTRKATLGSSGGVESAHAA